MTVAAALLAYAIGAGTLGARMLARAGWTARAPLLGILTYLPRVLLRYWELSRALYRSWPQLLPTRCSGYSGCCARSSPSASRGAFSCVPWPPGSCWGGFPTPRASRF